MNTDNATRMPALFVGHGNPMNALGHNEFAKGWRSMVEGLPRPEAILNISAHWETAGSFVNTTGHPKTIHDFYGFPEVLYRMRYPCPGSPECADAIRRIVKLTGIATDPERGLDHGTWAVLVHMYPEADIPVIQLSLDATRPPCHHYKLGRELFKLREQGILVVGSGNLVHNLSAADLSNGGVPYPWAESFDARAAELIIAGEDEKLIEYHSLGREAGLCVPTNEHYLPLLYILGLRGKDEKVTFVNERIAHRSVGMRSVRFG